MGISIRCSLRLCILSALCLWTGLWLTSCRVERVSRALPAAELSPVSASPGALQPMPTFTPPSPAPAEVVPSLYAGDVEAVVPPVVYLAAHEIHHLLNACLAPDPYGKYFWRREWVPEEYPYTEEPGGVYDAENDIIPMPWLEPLAFGGEFHPFGEARKALGDRLSPLWVGLYVNDPGLAGPIQDLVCGERMTFHDAWAGSSNNSQGRSVRWLGHITVPVREPVVHLHLRAEAGLRVFLGGELVVDAIEESTSWEWSDQQILTPGTHILRLEYVERTGPVQVELAWGYGSEEHLRSGQTTRSVALRTGPGNHYPVLTTLTPATPLWLEGWVPMERSQYWLGAAGVPAWWRTWGQGQPGWVASEAVAITGELDTTTFLSHWEARTHLTPQADPTSLCQRSVPAQYLILKTLTRGWYDRLSCAQVSAAQLASLDRLAGVLDYGTHFPQAGDLEGLSALTEMQIGVGAWPLPPAFLPPGSYQRIRLLATQPQVLAQDGWAAGVEVMHLLIRGGDWPELDYSQIVGEYIREGILQKVLRPELFRGMRIRHLNLNLPPAALLPANLLMQLQDLQQLQLRFRIPFESHYIRVGHPFKISVRLGGEPFPAQFLQELANLEVLHLEVPNWQLPATLLTGLTHLKVLHLRSDLQQALQLDKTALSQLEVLELVDTNVTPDYLQGPHEESGEPLSVPALWLQDLPFLRDLRINSKRIHYVPPNWLTHTPHLEVVELGGSNWAGLSHLCLGGVPKIRHLHLNWSAPLVAHANKAWGLDRYDASLLEPIPDQPCQTWAELAHLQYFHRNRDFQAAARDAPTVFWPSRPERRWEQVTHRDEVESTIRLRYDAALPAAIFSNSALRPTVVHFADPRLAALPKTFLEEAPQLRSLHLHLPELTALPKTFLEEAPQLRSLHLHLPELTALPKTFLEHNPTLGIAGAPRYSRAFGLWHYWMYPERRLYPALTLSLYSPNLTELPDHLLNGPGVNLESRKGYPGAAFSQSDRPRYTYVELALDSDLPAHVVQLTDAPGLTHLTLELPHLTALPEEFLVQASSLTHLTLALPQLTALPEEFLAHASSLTHLTLALPQLTALPEELLAQASSLTHLTLELPQLAALPEEFLVQASSLTHLTLELPQLTALPEEFLVQASSLTHLTLELPQLTALPEEFLVQASSLTHLTLELPQLTALPEEFLAGSHGINSVRLLKVHALRHLPAAFLADLPALLEVHITDAFVLSDLPPTFLAGSPLLMELILEARLQGLPPGFLADNRWLDQVVLQAEVSVGEPALSPALACSGTHECEAFTNSMQLAPLNRLCSWKEQVMRDKKGRCIDLYYSLASYLPCPNRSPNCRQPLEDALYGPWHMTCLYDAPKRHLQCGPLNLTAQAGGG